MSFLNIRLMCMLDPEQIDAVLASLIDELRDHPSYFPLRDDFISQEFYDRACRSHERRRDEIRSAARKVFEYKLSQL